jgi:hypothetical protein
VKTSRGEVEKEKVDMERERERVEVERERGRERETGENQEGRRGDVEKGRADRVWNRSG